MKFCRNLLSLVVFTFLIHGSLAAQTTSFTYQGDLQLSGQPANSNFDFEFLLYDAGTGGTQIGTTAVRSNVAVADGKFTVSLDFGANFTGPERFLEIRVRQAGSGGFTILDPRQRIGSSPYAVRSVAAGTADTATTADNAVNATNATTANNALNLGGIAANQYVLTTDPRMSDPRPPIGGSGAYIQNSSNEQNNASFNILGDGRARNFNAINTFRLGGERVLSTPGASGNLYIGILAGPSIANGGDNTFIGRLAGNLNAGGNANTFVGVNSGYNNTLGDTNAFFGYNSGTNNTSGDNNSFFGSSAGNGNTTGLSNSNFGTSAGSSNTTGSHNAIFGNAASFANIGSDNSVFGSDAGRTITNGSSNSFFGREAATALLSGNSNSFFGARAGRNMPSGTRNSLFGFEAGIARSGDNLTLIGAQAQTSVDGLTYATAIGANATVSTSNTIVLGRTGGEDTVSIPGPLQASQFTSSILNAGTQFNIGGNRILGNAGTGNLFAGIGSGAANTPAGTENAFFGFMSGNANTGGFRNTFIGSESGRNTTSGTQNTFVGAFAGLANTEGVNNTYVGNQAGQTNQLGSGNAFFGSFSGTTLQTGNLNTFIGDGAGNSLQNGSGNTFIGQTAGAASNNVGNNNTLLGKSTNFAGNISFATAIGAEATVTQSNRIVLGRSAGQDIVSVPGNLSVIGSTNVPTLTVTTINAGTLNIPSLSAATVNAGTQFNLNGSRVLHLSGANSTFVGTQAGGNTAGSGSSNSAFGHLSGASIGSNTFSNSFFGHLSGQNTNGGSSNAFYGADAGRGNLGGSDNTFLGRGSGIASQTGSSNTFIGRLSGSSNISGSNNTTLGASADVALSNLSFATAIGAESSVTTSNTIVLGRSNGADTVRIWGRLRLFTFGSPSATPICIDNSTIEITLCSSSIRYKENVFDYTSGLSLIRRLRPVYFDWKHNGVRDFGLVAEEVAAVEPLLATTNKDGEIQGVNYERVGVVLVNAVNEQQAEIERIKADSENKSRQIDQLLEANRRQQEQIEALTKLFCSGNPAAGICREKP